MVETTSFLGFKSVFEGGGTYLEGEILLEVGKKYRFFSVNGSVETHTVLALRTTEAGDPLALKIDGYPHLWITWGSIGGFEAVNG